MPLWQTQGSRLIFKKTTAGSHSKFADCAERSSAVRQAAELRSAQSFGHLVTDG